MAKLGDPAFHELKVLLGRTCQSYCIGLCWVWEREAAGSGHSVGHSVGHSGGRDWCPCSLVG
jgi:hypothetical protein